MKRIFILFAILISFLVAKNVVAQTPAPATSTAVSTETASPADTPVEVPAPSEKAVRYYRSGMGWWIFWTLWGFVVPIVILFTGLSARLRTLSWSIGKKWFFALAIYVTLYTLLTFLIDLPLSYVGGFMRQHSYGLSNQTFAKWITDALKALAIGIIATPLFIWVPYLLVKKSPRRWWLYTAIAAIPFVIFVLLVVPIWIDPLFNKFGPMKNKQLEAQILALADRSGIEGARVFEVDKSVDTKMVNAYVTGLANSKRIVLWDTIIAKLQPEELLFVMGHEMGHYVLNHVRQIIFFAIVVILIGLWAVHRSAQWMMARHGQRFGFSELSDFASLPLVLLLFSLATFLLSPALLAMSRHNEHEADRFALELTHSDRACATSFAKLQEENLGVPRPGLFYKIFRASHPTVGDRIDFCNSYKPWEKGEKGKYEAKFEAAR